MFSAGSSVFGAGAQLLFAEGESDEGSFRRTWGGVRVPHSLGFGGMKRQGQDSRQEQQNSL